MNANRSLYQSIALLGIATVILLMIPLMAMQFTDEVVWTLGDFILAGSFLFGTGITYKLVTRKSGDAIYKFAMGFALFTGLLLIWANLAVGIVGAEGNPINLLYFGVILVGIIGAVMAGSSSRKMGWVMFGMASSQALVAIIILLGGFYSSPSSTVFQIISANGFFITLFLVSGWLFRYTARQNISNLG